MNAMTDEDKANSTAGKLVCEAFAAQNVNTVFCLSGAAHAHLLRDMVKAGFDIVSTRTEPGTVSAADGYARVTGNIGIAMVVGKQGLPNTIGGIRTAQLACSPLLILAHVYEPRSQESMDEGPDDQLAMVRPYVKWAKIVPSAERLAEFVNAAIHRATTGRPGVVVLGIPVHFPKAIVSSRPLVDTPKTAPSVSYPDPAAIAQAADLIRAAKRPVMLIGTGAASANAGDEIRALTAMGLPVFGHALGRGLVPEDIDLSYPWPVAQVAAKHADVVVSIGMRLTQRIGYGMAPRFAPDAKFIQVDIEPGELGRNRTIDVPICADAKASAAALRDVLTAAGYSAPDRGWIGEATAARRGRIDELAQDRPGPIHPLQIGRRLMERMPANTIFVADGADVYNWMSGIVRIRADRSYMDHYPLGSMGICTGLALGAAAAAKEIAGKTGTAPRPVVLVTGDGSFGYYTAELNSAKLAGLSLKIIISNDGAWGTEKNSHLMHWDDAINCELGQCDYHLIGQAYGCVSEKVSELEELSGAIDRALAADGPVVLNVLTDPDAGLARKQDNRLQMVTFEDLPKNQDAHHVVDLA
jgi:acetolactate synthase I/II/III large subunit